MKNTAAALLLFSVMLCACTGGEDLLAGLRFGMNAKTAGDLLKRQGISLQKCDQWYPRIDTYFCFMEKYGYPRVALFLEFFEDRLYAVRYRLDDGKDPLGTYAAVVTALTKELGRPLSTEQHIPPGFIKGEWDERHREIMKKGGYLSHRWSLKDATAVESKVYAGSYYFQVEWRRYHIQRYNEAVTFKKSIIMNP